MSGKSILQFAAGWAFLFGAYLLCTGSAGSGEIWAGTAIATMATLLAVPLSMYFTRLLYVKAVWLIFFRRIPFAMLKESWLLLSAMIRKARGKEVTGRFISHPYPGMEDDAFDSARRFFMTFGVCITPNSYLVNYDRRKRQVLVHQLVGKHISRVDRLFVELP